MGHINEKSVKILWGGSGNLCAHPECTTPQPKKSRGMDFEM